MKNLLLCFTFLLCFFGSKTIAQTTFESKAKAIEEKLENITKDEKAKLKAEIEAVNEQLEKGLLNKEQADNKKQEITQASATRIENRINLIRNELNHLVKQKTDDIVEKNDSVWLNWGYGKIYKKRIYANKSQARTTPQFVFAFGLNNVITDGNIKNSDFKFAGSRFYEWGFTYNSRLAKNNNLLHLKYGASLMYNDLRPTQNRIFVVNGNQTSIENSAINLKSSRFRNVYLVAPLHLEFDFSKKKNKGGNSYFTTHESFRFGIGGYAGVRIKSKQKIEYEINNIEFDEKTKGSFNASNFIYGVSAYVGHRATSLYLKYDLNPMFKNNTVDQNNISLGIRFDFN